MGCLLLDLAGCIRCERRGMYRTNRRAKLLRRVHPNRSTLELELGAKGQNQKDESIETNYGSIRGYPLVVPCSSLLVFSITVQVKAYSIQN